MKARRFAPRFRSDCASRVQLFAVNRSCGWGEIVLERFGTYSEPGIVDFLATHLPDMSSTRQWRIIIADDVLAHTSRRVRPHYIRRRHHSRHSDMRHRPGPTCQQALHGARDRGAPAADARRHCRAALFARAVHRNDGRCVDEYGFALCNGRRVQKDRRSHDRARGERFFPRARHAEKSHPRHGGVYSECLLPRS
jgi:hypothetical protein